MAAFIILIYLAPLEGTLTNRTSRHIWQKRSQEGPDYPLQHQYNKKWRSDMRRRIGNGRNCEHPLATRLFCCGVADYDTYSTPIALNESRTVLVNGITSQAGISTEPYAPKAKKTVLRSPAKSGATTPLQPPYCSIQPPKVTMQ